MPILGHAGRAAFPAENNKSPAAIRTRVVGFRSSLVFSAEPSCLTHKAIIVKKRLVRAARASRSVAPSSFLTIYSCPTAVPTRYMRNGHAAFRTAARRGPRADQYRQDPPCDRAHARSPERHDRLPAAPAGAGELRPGRQVAWRARGRADHRGGEDPAPEPVLFRLHGRVDAARPG